jgi:hypothetical protein
VRVPAPRSSKRRPRRASLQHTTVTAAGWFSW